MASITYLPRPVPEVYDWQQQAACRGLDSSVFFHPSGERGPSRAGRAQRAKEICARCPVLRQCREHALASHEPYGVWGGLTEEERDRMLRQDRRGAELTPRDRREACGPWRAGGRGAAP